MLPAPLWLALVRAMLVVDDGTRITPLSLHGEGKEEAASPQKKESQPRLAALVSPFQGKGLAWSFPPSYGRRCPEGAEVGWGKRDEKERGKSSQAGNLREYPSAAGAVPLPQTITPCGATVNENEFLLSLGWRRRHSSFPIGRLSPLSKLFWSPLLNHILSRAYAP